MRVRGLRTALQLNSVCPHGLEDTFVEEKFVRERVGTVDLGARTLLVV